MSPPLRMALATCGLLFATAQPVALRAAVVRRAELSIASHVTAAAQRFAIPEGWIYAVMRVESAGNPRAVSPKGATGLMQIMPSTWTYLQARYGLGTDIYDARDNILAGAAYMRELYDRYGAPGFLAAYNAGPSRYVSYLRDGRALPAETVAYVAKLTPVTGAVSIDAKRLDPVAWTRSSVFVDGPVGALAVSDADTATAKPARATARDEQTSHLRPGIFVALSGKHPR